MKENESNAGEMPKESEVHLGVIKHVVCNRAKENCFDCPHATDHYPDALNDPEPCTESPCVLHGIDVKCGEVL